MVNLLQLAGQYSSLLLNERVQRRYSSGVGHQGHAEGGGVLLCLHFLAASAKEPAGFVVGPGDGGIFHTLGTGVLIP